MLLNKLSRLLQTMTQSKRKLHRIHVEQSFNARLEMEKEAQRQVAARLRVVEMTLKNQGRIK